MLGRGLLPPVFYNLFIYRYNKHNPSVLQQYSTYIDGIGGSKPPPYGIYKIIFFFI